ncbi:MAG: TIGR03643 family protein [Patescibacteria group bacterium]
MKLTTFNPEETEQIILMAWGDTISFETITREFGLTENQVIAFMRTNQSPKTYIRWRKRVESRNGDRSKHEALSKVSSRRQKFNV